ncbi:MAG: PQQ-like beta-propeller repeat protein [Chitinispirillales bacterium]|jgi:hypothetical protein|nr:PQQ-like beta-propeller repeat protein [Chitinispirillales bacterium]
MPNRPIGKTLRTAIAIVPIIAAAAAAADWPNFHGPDRTNKSAEAGLLKQWPKEGPALIWMASGVGNGYSGAAVSGGAVYTAGVKNNANYVFAFSSAGKLLWEKPAGKVWEATRAFARSYNGTRSTPTVEGGAVYYLSDIGFLIALDAKTGAAKWSVDLRAKYDGEIPDYGYSESPLVHGNRLYCSPYGKKASVVCLDKNTGKPIWEAPAFNTGADGGDAGFASFIMVENSGYKQLISQSRTFLYGMDSETGKTLWKAPFLNSRENNCTDAVYSDGYVFVTSGYGRGSMLVKLSKKGDGVAAEVVYDNSKMMDNHHGGVVLHNGYIYGSGHNSAGWFCLEMKSGKQMWKTAGKGSLTFADGMLYVYDEKGTVSLVKATPEAYTEVSSFKVPEGGMKSYFWAHPVVSNGVLYVRYANDLYAYDVKGK